LKKYLKYDKINNIYHISYFMEINITTASEKEFKKLLSSNPSIIWLQDLFRSYVWTILEEEQKQKRFQKEDFMLFEWYFENLKEYHQILKDQWIDTSIEILEIFVMWQSIDEFKELIRNNQIIDLIKYWNSENIRLFFSKNWLIKDTKSLEDLLNNPKWYEIENLIKYWNSENIRLFFSKEFYNVNDKKSLEDLLDNPRWDKIKDLIENWNLENIRLFFSKDWLIKDKNSLEDLLDNPRWVEIKYLIEDWNSESIRLFFSKYWLIKGTKSLEESIDLIIQNYYIKNKSNLIRWRYRTKKRDILSFIQKYKPQINKNNPYIQWNNYKQKEYWVGEFFSIINLKTNIDLNWKQVREKMHTIWWQDFFDINDNKTNITVDIQIAINRLFSPLFPMTRLLKLINWKINNVSVDVENNDSWVDLSKLKDSIPEEIIKFFIMIYQFLTLDYDRRLWHNIWKENTIYDFDLIFYGIRNLDFFDWIFNNRKYYQEMWKILYILKDYLIKEVDELIIYYESKWQEDIVRIFKKLRIRLDMLNFSNLIYCNEQVNPEIEVFAREVDSENYKS